MLSSVILSVVSVLQHIKYNYIYNALALYLVLIWLTYAIWLWNDTDKRFGSQFIRIPVWIIATATFVFGLLLYLLIRPLKHDEEAYWIDLERKYLEYEAYGIEKCVICGFQLRPDFLICPSCGEELRAKCSQCTQLIDVTWKRCPYCGKAHKPQPAHHKDAEAKKKSLGMKELWEGLKKNFDSSMQLPQEKTEMLTEKKAVKEYKKKEKDKEKPTVVLKDLFYVKEKTVKKDTKAL